MMQNLERICPVEAQGILQSQQEVRDQSRSSVPCSLPPVFQSKGLLSPCCLASEVEKIFSHLKLQPPLLESV